MTEPPATEGIPLKCRTEGVPLSHKIVIVKKLKMNILAYQFYQPHKMLHVFPKRK